MSLTYLNEWLTTGTISTLKPFAEVRIFNLMFTFDGQGLTDMYASKSIDIILIGWTSRHQDHVLASTLGMEIQMQRSRQRWPNSLWKTLKAPQEPLLLDTSLSATNTSCFTPRGPEALCAVSCRFRGKRIPIVLQQLGEPQFFNHRDLTINQEARSSFAGAHDVPLACKYHVLVTPKTRPLVRLSF
jgi:hypothetical protein